MKIRDFLPLSATAILGLCILSTNANATVVASVDFGEGPVATEPGPAGPGPWTFYSEAQSTGVTIGPIGVLLNEYGSTDTNPPMGVPNESHTFDFSPATGSGNLNDNNPPGSGFYGDNSVYGEAFFDRNNTTGFAILVTGLAAGEYDFYTMGVEQGQPGREYNSNIQAGIGTTFNSQDGTDAVVAAVARPGSFVEGENFVKQRISVGSGENVAIFYHSTNNDFTTINGLQIERIPEPSMLTLVGFAVSGLLHARRRR